MADNSDKTALSRIDAVFNQLAKSNLEAQRSATRLNDALDKLSKFGAEKLLEQMKQQLKSTKIFNDEQLSLIKNLKDLSAAINHQEDIAERVAKAQKKGMDRLHADYAKYGARVTAQSGKEFATKRAYIEELRQLGIKNHKHAETIIEATEALKVYTDRTLQAATANDKLSKTLEGVKSKLAENISRYASVTEGLKAMKKAMSQGIDEWVAISRVGLQGTFMELQTSALKLNLTFEEYAEIVSKHRDIVLQLGGGAEGVKNFGDYLNEASKGLEFLGKDAKKATANFAGVIQSMGVNVLSASGQDQMKKLQNQYKDFAKIFGDSYDQYADLIALQAQDEVVQGRILGLGKKQVGVVADEIKARVENERLMGMSNEQLTDFNKKVSEITNPENTDLQGMQTQALNYQNALAMLQKASPNDPKLAAAIKTIQPAVNAAGIGDNDTVRKITDSKEGKQALLDINNARAQFLNRPGSNGFDRYAFNTYMNQAGGLKDLTKDMTGAGIKQLNGSDAQSNLANMTKAQLDGLDQAVQATDAFSKAMMAARDTVDTFNTITHNSAAQFAMGLGEVILGLIGKDLIMKGGSKALAIARGLMAGGGAAAAGAAGAAEGAAGAAAGAAATGGIRAGLMTAGRFALGAASSTVGVGATLGLYSSNLNSGESSYLASRQGLAGSIAEAAKLTGVDPSILANIASQESGGKSNARNPNSSASGLFQFTDGTWLETIKKYGAQAGVNVNGMTSSQLLALKSDQRLSAIMGAFYIRDGQRATGATTGGGMYLAHLLGPGGAKAVLSANPNTPLRSLVSADAYKSNAALFNKTGTAGGLLSWANNRIGGSVDTSPVTNAVNGMGGSTTVDTDSNGTPVYNASDVDGGSNVELQKQTQLLAMIAQNTSGRNKSIVPDSQKAPGTRRETAVSN